MTVATMTEQPMMASSAAAAAATSPLKMTATTPVFLRLREALLKQYGVHGAVDAFEALVDLEERPVFVSVVRHEILQKFFEGMSAANPAIGRAYLDAKRGLKQPLGKSGNLGSMPVKLTSDVMYFAHTAGSLYRVPERISPEDLLNAMRRFECGGGKKGVEGAENTTIEEVRAFIDEWDTASYLHRDAGLHVLDFSLFLRFACSELDALTAANNLGGAAAAVEKAKLNVQRQARDVIALKRRQATEEARAIAREREGEMLVGVLREELAVYQANRSPAVGSIQQPMAFKIDVSLPGKGEGERTSGRPLNDYTPSTCTDAMLVTVLHACSVYYHRALCTHPPHFSLRG